MSTASRLTSARAHWPTARPASRSARASPTSFAQALAAWRGRGLDLDAPYWLAAIAAGRRAAGRLDDARAMLDEAIAQMERHGERVHESELYRLRGELTAERGGADAEAALPDLERALGVARAQGARLLERRAAVSLHRVLSALGRPGASPLAESTANGRI